QRTVSVTNNGDTFKMKTLEFFKLGLGAEIRISTLFVLSPLATISTGVMNDTEGTVTYDQPASDGRRTPPYTNGKTIDDSRGYVIVGIGVGAHFDVFGK